MHKLDPQQVECREFGRVLHARRSSSASFSRYLPSSFADRDCALAAARSASTFTTSSAHATPERTHAGSRLISPRRRRALAAARSGHGPFSFWSRILRDDPRCLTDLS